MVCGAHLGPGAAGDREGNQVLVTGVPNPGFTVPALAEETEVRLSLRLDGGRGTRSGVETPYECCPGTLTNNGGWGRCVRNPPNRA